VEKNGSASFKFVTQSGFGATLATRDRSAPIWRNPNWRNPNWRHWLYVWFNPQQIATKGFSTVLLNLVIQSYFI
jgi:hypothetical protein